MTDYTFVNNTFHSKYQTKNIHTFFKLKRIQIQK
jgi:hypothetical protein